MDFLHEVQQFAITISEFASGIGSAHPETMAIALQILEIIWIDILLSGDNAIVIALACRTLPDHQRRWGILLGSLAAVALRILFAFVVVELLSLPFVKVAGGVLLLWIAMRLVFDQEEEKSVRPARSLFAAVRTIAIADGVMSLDNVIAIAAAAKEDLVLIVFGLALSIPLIVFGSSLILALLNRFPVLVWAGAALLGWIAGDLIGSDPTVAAWMRPRFAQLAFWWAPAGMAVVLAGAGLARWSRKPA
ncbi:TerC family protein [Methyloferula stellata]|uniref:TerC family protein n=1 Tax=Methyloferula stellata TaxID=876270 RepID=UPI00036EECFC